MSTPDCYGFITNINILWNNKPSALTDALPYDFYLMSVRNGCDMSYMQWQNYVGSVVCINPCADLPSENTDASGVAQNTTFQITVTFQNISTNNNTYTLYIDYISEGILTVENQDIQHRTNTLTIENVKAADTAHGQLKVSNMYGGYRFIMTYCIQ